MPGWNDLRLTLERVVDGLLDNMVCQVHADVVHHNGGDDDVDAQMRPQQAGQQRPERAAKHTREKRNDPAKRSGKVETDRHKKRTDRADNKLSGSADVKKACLERKADAKTRHNDGRRVVQDVAQPLHTAGEAAEHQCFNAVGRLRRIAQRQHEETEQQADDDCDQGGQQPGIIAPGHRAV